MSFRSARLRAGLKVTDVMKVMQVSDAAVYMWETGLTRPRIANLLKLATLYGCTVDALLTGDDTEEDTPQSAETPPVTAAERGNSL